MQPRVAFLPGVVLLLCATHPARSSDPLLAMRSTEVTWDFRSGLDGWANATSEEMQTIVYARGGTLRGEVTGPQPHFDSPMFDIRALSSVPTVDKHHIVVRFRYVGSATRAAFWVRKFTSAPAWNDYHDTVWSGSEMYNEVAFDVVGDGVFRTIYVPFYKHANGSSVNVTQLRMLPAMGAGVQVGDRVEIDWVKIAKAPTIRKVEGCTRLPSAPRSQRQVGQDGPGRPWDASVSCISGWKRDYERPDYQQWCNPGIRNKYFGTAAFTAVDVDNNVPGRNGPLIPSGTYAATYNCLPRGGERITITGSNFGSSHALVSINGAPCTDVKHTVDETEVRCTLPRGTAAPAMVRVTNGALQGLWDQRPYLAYAIPVPAPLKPTVANIGACAVDVAWVDPQYWHAVTITGYVVQRRPVDGTFGHDVILGNVTRTTLIGLRPDMLYEFRVAALTEDQVHSEQWLHLDLYGRRRPVPGARQSGWSEPSEVVRTLRHDIHFAHFDANSTLNHSTWDARNDDAHLVLFGGEGHYGLRLVGDANVANCNASFACCDGYNASAGGCPNKTVICSAVGNMGVNHLLSGELVYVNGSSVPDEITSNFQSNGAKISFVHDNVSAVSLTHPPAALCGPALRLTASQARLSGAMWYSRKQQVREGFTTEFTFRIANPSTVCKDMDDVYTHCRSRGADGFAFVVQNQAPLALGKAGKGIGYEGIENSVAVEFDTWYNYDQLDAFENHVSVHTRGWQHPNSANHSFSLGSAVEIPPFTDGFNEYDATKSSRIRTDGIHKVKIAYSPVFDERIFASGKFVASPHVAHFLHANNVGTGPEPTWGDGVGLLSVFIDDMLVPVLVVPLNIAATMQLDNGRAWVGFTAATGSEFWQVHDILSWDFVATRRDTMFLAREELD